MKMSFGGVQLVVSKPGKDEPSQNSIIAKAVARAAELERENALLSRIVAELQTRSELFAAVERRRISVEFDYFEETGVLASARVETGSTWYIEEEKAATAAEAVRRLLEKLEAIEG
jgi:hypothetical protein